MVVLDVQSQGSLWAPTSSWNLFNFDFHIDSLHAKKSETNAMDSWIQQIIQQVKASHLP